MSDFPKWLEKAIPCGYETRDGETIEKLRKALTIALEALGQVSMYARVVHGSKAKDYGEVANDAVRRIEELGK